MDLSTARSLIKGRLGNYQNTAIDTLIDQEIDAAQERLEGGDFMPWFLLTEASTAKNVINEERLSVPTDFIMEWEEGALYYKEETATEYCPLSKDDYDYLRKTYSDYESPKGYALANDNFLIVPTPTVVYDWKMRYYAKQAVISTDTGDNPWLVNAGDWIVAEAGIIMANNYVYNDKAAQGFLIMRQEAKARVEKLDTARREAGAERIMGE